ncbi:MAG: hypothetical protein MK198_01160 [Gracilimonas sp.]|uniref:hypothetical protein n=1 Tax=Gracilimonas sp. TaxID=1974203 RepID=UPI003751B65A|nr:hypothetical protein [Gracilimonas sp.]
MFRKIKAKIKQLRQERPLLYVFSFNDLLADQIDWFSLKGGTPEMYGRDNSRNRFD